MLDTEHIRARSLDTLHKELLASVISDNLVTQFRRQAAQLARVSPRQLSFKRVWPTSRQFLLPPSHTDPALWREHYRRALSYATQGKLPHRPGRSYDRETYPRRPKSNQFKKRKQKPPPTNESKCHWVSAQRLMGGSAQEPPCSGITRCTLGAHLSLNAQ